MNDSEFPKPIYKGECIGAQPPQAEACGAEDLDCNGVAGDAEGGCSGAGGSG